VRMIASKHARRQKVYIYVFNLEGTGDDDDDDDDDHDWKIPAKKTKNWQCHLILGLVLFKKDLPSVSPITKSAPLAASLRLNQPPTNMPRQRVFLLF